MSVECAKYRAELFKMFQTGKKRTSNALHPYTPYLLATLLGAHFSQKQKNSRKFHFGSENFFPFSAFFSFFIIKKDYKVVDGKLNCQKEKLSVKFQDSIFVLFVQDKNSPKTAWLLLFFLQAAASSEK